MTEQEGMMVGKNGVKISDAGDCYRAHSGLDIVNPQPVDYQTRDGRKNGVRYFLGPNRMTGEMKIAWIDYPKSMTTLEHLLDDPDVVDTITYCNVCNAMNQIASRPVESSKFIASRPVSVFS